MASKPKLNPEILDFLHKRLGKPISTIRSDISRLRRQHPQATLNAMAQVYAEQRGESVRRLLSKNDKLSIPPFTAEKIPTVKSKKPRITRQHTKEIIRFETTDHFLNKHIEEVNRAYSNRCYTCVFVLTRKIIENLIIAILKAKYPANRDLYFDVGKGRNQDFSVVLDNLFKRRNEFDNDRKEAIERLHQKLKPFKKDANDKVHSLYHVVESSMEIDEWNLDTIMVLLRTII